MSAMGCEDREMVLYVKAAWYVAQLGGMYISML